MEIKVFRLAPCLWGVRDRLRKNSTVALFGIQTAARLIRVKLASRLQSLGVYAGQEGVLLLLSQNDGLSPGFMADRMGVRPPTVTKTISRLANQGFVEKQASDDDQRQTRVFLTPIGRKVITEIERLLRATENDAFRGIEQKERAVLVSLLRRIEANLVGEIVDSDYFQEDD